MVPDYAAPLRRALHAWAQDKRFRFVSTADTTTCVCLRMCVCASVRVRNCSFGVSRARSRPGQ